jgi:hypothetical protein
MLTALTFADKKTADIGAIPPGWSKHRDCVCRQDAHLHKVHARVQHTQVPSLGMMT